MSPRAGDTSHHQWVALHKLGDAGSSARLGHWSSGHQALTCPLLQVGCRGASVMQATLLLKRRDRLRLAVGLGHAA